VPVTLVEQQPQLLPAEDPEAVRVLARNLEARGVSLATGTQVDALAASADGVQLTLSNGRTIAAERCLVAVGLSPNTQGLGLEPLGIQTAGGIAVDRYLRTSQAHIAAIGDCLAGHGLAHWASHEGALAVANLAGDPPAAVDPHLVPRCVYTDPEVAHVGMLESQITAPYKVSRFPVAALGKSLCDEEPEGFVKLAVDEATGRVLGVTIIGAQASSLIHLAALALQQGLTAQQLARSITAHPTLPEALTEAAAQCYGEALYSAQRARSKTPSPANTRT
jgi:dihydrolipoamide dehydrogenase